MTGAEIRHEWAVRWPEGEIEECATQALAENIVRLYGSPVLVRREVVVVGEWLPLRHGHDDCPDGPDAHEDSCLNGRQA